MLNENGLTFKDFEKKTFEMICKLGQEYTKDFLERYNIYLMENRDKNAYRNKGKRTTTVKTTYGYKMSRPNVQKGGADIFLDQLSFNVRY